MAKTVIVFLADGFEEIEAVATIDLLRRAGLSVITVAVGDSLEVSGAHGIVLRADQGLDFADLHAPDAVVLPGGLPGVTNLATTPRVLEVVRQVYNQGRLVAAICAAPSILGSLGILEGREATCYPSFEPQLTGYRPTERTVVVSDHVITARSAGVTFEFAHAITTALLGQEAADAVADAVLYKPSH